MANIDRLMLISLAALLALSALVQPSQDNTAAQVSPETVENVTTMAIHQPVTDLVETPPAPVKAASELPDFAAIGDVREKKQAFFSFLLPKVREANNEIRAKRRYLLQIRDQLRSGEAVTATHAKTLAELARSYRVRGATSEADLVNALLVRVDVVPESLVLAQAANESGWGTSRFARQANNLFGVWCFTRDCGLPPLHRDEGLTHEVASYASVEAGIRAYIHTLNTNSAYVELRQIRAGSREEAQYISGLALAEGLLKYSARGADYVREIQSMIRVNNLQRFNLPVKV